MTNQPKPTRNPQQDEETMAFTPPQGQSSRRLPLKYLKTTLILITLLVLIILSSINISLSTRKRVEPSKTTLDSIIVALNTLDAKIDSNHVSLSSSIEDIDKNLYFLSARLFPSTQISPKFGGHVCALTAFTVMCVGENVNGSLGIDPSLHPKTSTPLRLHLPDHVSPVKIVTGLVHTCILSTSKRVYCFGKKDEGQLGNTNSTGMYSFIPVQVMKKNDTPLEDVVDIEAGYKHTCAILASGLMYCWGFEQEKTFEWNNEDNIDVAMIALSSVNTCVVRRYHRSKVQCKGYNPCFENDQIFDMGQEIIKLTSGFDHFCALLIDGTAKCFGCNYAGQLGNGLSNKISESEPAESAEPVLEESTGKPLSGITDINAGPSATCLISHGSPLCFGSNVYYQLGIANAKADVLYPTALSVNLPEGKKAVSVHVGYWTGHIVYSDNTVYAWGTNKHGTLGAGPLFFDDIIGDEAGEEAVEMLFKF